MAVSISILIEMLRKAELKLARQREALRQTENEVEYLRASVEGVPGKGR